jgi:hypothetical protein
MRPENLPAHADFMSIFTQELEDFFEGAVLFGYGVQTPKILQRLLLTGLTFVSGVNTYKEFKTLPAEHSLDQNLIKLVPHVMEFTSAGLLYFSEYTKLYNESKGEQMLQFALWNFVNSLMFRGLLEFCQKNSSHVPHIITGWLSKLTPYGSIPHQISICTSGLFSLFRSVSAKPNPGANQPPQTPTNRRG